MIQRESNIVVPLFLALALIVSPGAMASSVTANVQVDQLQAHGTVESRGSLAALLHPTDASAPSALSGFGVTAKTLRIETDQSNTSIVVEEASFNSHPLASTTNSDHEDASISSANIGAGYRFNVFSAPPGAEVELHANCASTVPSREDQITHEALVQFRNERPDHVVDASNAIDWEACDDSAIATIRGDFWFSAWAIDLEVKDEAGTHSYWSGHRDEQAVTEDRELYVYVTNGTLQVPLPEDSAYALILGPEVSTSVQGGLQLSNARGTLDTPAGRLEVDGEPVTLNGDFLVSAARNDGALNLQVDGRMDGAHVAGAAIIIPDPDALSLPWLWITLTMLGVAMAGLAVVWYARPLYHERQNRIFGGDRGSMTPETRGQRRGVGYWLMAKRCNQRDQHRLGLFYAKRAAKSFPTFPQAHAMQAIESAFLARHEDVLELTLRVYMDLRPGEERSRLAALAATSAMHADQDEAAMEWLEMAFSEDPLLAREHLKRRLFEPLRKRGRFRVLLDGGDADWTQFDPAIY